MKYANRIIVLLLAATLAGCGGGGGGKGSIANPGKDPDPGPGHSGDAGGRGSLAGRFVDAPVQGLRYIVGQSENSCAKLEAGCVTDADGTFHYNSGDKVAFYLGGVELGRVTARGVVTPQTVAEAVAGEGVPAKTVEDIRNNLLVFLQSFDADGDPENGITVTPVIAAAVAGAAIPVDFTVSAAEFDATMNNLVPAVKAAPNVPTTVAVRKRDQAIAHYQRSLENNIAGTYAWSTAAGVIDPNNPVRTLTLFRSGEFLFAGYENDASCAESGSDPMGNGIVTGSYTYDAAAGTLTVTRDSGVVHTTGDCGIGTGVYDMKNFDGTLLALDERGSAEPAFYFSRVEQSTATVAGSWLLPESVLRSPPEPVVVTFFAISADGKQGRYILGDARSDNGRGIEYGCYAIAPNGSASFNAGSGGTCENVADTNGEEGFHGIAAKSFKVDGYGRLVLVEEDDEEGEDLVVALMPLNGGRVDVAHLGGAWYLELEPGADPEKQPEMFVLVVDGATGDFVFGTQHESGPGADPDECLTSFYESSPYGEYESYGNGVEAGQLVEEYPNKGVGILLPDIEDGLDTNGDCGMRNAEKSRDPFLYRLSPVNPSALLAWNEDESLVFRRMPSENNSVVGVWQYFNGTEKAPELSAFFPGGQVMHIMYDAENDTRDQGIHRERYTVSGDTVSFNGVGFEYCVDTIDDKFCNVAREDTVTLNATRTEGTHDDGTMRKIAQP